MFILYLFSIIQQNFSSQLSKAGVNYYTEYPKIFRLTWEIYVDKLTDFHQCPLVKMCYDFVSIVNISLTTFDS